MEAALEVALEAGLGVGKEASMEERIQAALRATLQENAQLRARVSELEALLASAQAGDDHRSRLAALESAGLIPGIAARGYGQAPSYCSDAHGFEAMPEVPAGPLRSPRASADMAEMRMKLERTCAERDALAAELEGLRSWIENATSTLRESGALHKAQIQIEDFTAPLTSRSNLSWASSARHSMQGSVVSGAPSTVLSFRSVQSQWSGLRAVSSTSLESIANWVFAINPQNIRPTKTYERVNIPPGDPRRSWIEDYLLASLQPHRRAYNSDEWCPIPEIRILNVQEVINEMASAAYRQELGQLRANRPGDRTGVPELEHSISVRTDPNSPRLNEVLLFHGCKWESVFAILREGFDSRLGGTNAGAAFGIGSYFSTVASKADLYTQRWGDWQRRPAIEVPGQLRSLILARVALGEVHEMRLADPGLRRPPMGADNLRCESVIGVPRERGGVVDYDEFIIYKPSQAMAQFVVEYEHLPTCQCRTCLSTNVP